MNTHIDLHIHSIYSDDGEFSPSKLIEMCHNKKIDVMAIADHNCIRAIDEAYKLAKKFNIQFIPAIEIDCTYKNINLHILGYGIDYQNPIFKKIENNILNQELSTSKEKILLTNKLGFDINENDLIRLSGNGVYTGEMFAEVLLNDERYLEHPLLKPYRNNNYRGDNPYVNFYWDFYSQGKPCYTKINYPDLKEIIEIIHNCGGIAVLAHPGNNLNNNFSLFDEMIELGIDGVEAFSNYHDKNTTDYFYNKAIKNNLLFTCGSDFHGKTKPAIELGNCHCTIDKNLIIEKLKEYKLIK